MCGWLSPVGGSEPAPAQNQQQQIRTATVHLDSNSNGPPNVTTRPACLPVPLYHIVPQEVLRRVPADVDTLVFPNYESLPEREDVTDPFLEVSLFKKNYAHVVSGEGGLRAGCEGQSVECGGAELRNGRQRGQASMQLRAGGRQLTGMRAPAARPHLATPPALLLCPTVICRPVLQVIRCGGPRQP